MYLFWGFFFSEMEDLTGRICWDLVKKEGYIAIWRKPLNNSCYRSRDAGAQPPMCNPDDNPDSVWYASIYTLSTNAIFNFFIFLAKFELHHWHKSVDIYVKMK